MIFAVRVDFDHFLRDLQAGDPVVWAIVVGSVLLTGFSLYRKYRTFSNGSHSPTVEEE